MDLFVPAGCTRACRTRDTAGAQGCGHSTCGIPCGSHHEAIALGTAEAADVAQRGQRVSRNLQEKDTSARNTTWTLAT